MLPLGSLDMGQASKLALRASMSFFGSDRSDRLVSREALAFVRDGGGAVARVRCAGAGCDGCPAAGVACARSEGRQAARSKDS